MKLKLSRYLMNFLIKMISLIKDKENIISTYFLLKASYELSINKNIEKCCIYNAIESIDKQFSIENSKRIFNILSLSDCYNFDEFFFLTSEMKIPHSYIIPFKI